jgi:hypothetical protein
MELNAPTPNSGQSVEDYVVDSDTITQDALRQTFAIDASKQVRLVKLAFVKYQHPDLQEITRYLQRKWRLFITKCQSPLDNPQVN